MRKYKHSRPGVFKYCIDAVIALNNLYPTCTSSINHSKGSKSILSKTYKALKPLASEQNFYGFSSFNRNTLIMRNLMKSTLVLVITLISVFTICAQTGTLNSQTELLNEFVEGKFNHLKAQNGNVEVIFRNDRLEIFESKDNEEKQSFLFFDNANKVEPTPVGMLTQTVRPIPNSGMAAVLGTKDMNVDTYEKVIYKDLYKGADLVITVLDKQINFVLENKSNQTSIPFGLSTWGSDEMTLLNDIITFVNHNNVEISSTEKELEVDGRAMNFSNNKSASSDISFTLNFLN